jgi:ABC-type sugar transport system ATPase subunit
MISRIEVRGVSKTFPGVRALDDVSTAIAPGEICALLGENGAGKSTLGKILAGVYQPDQGEIWLDGEKLGALDEVAAGALGIGIVHQEGSLVSQLSVAENIYAGRQPSGRFGQIDRRTMREGARRLLNQLGVALDPDARVGRLSAAQSQVVEIAKALSRDLKVLILDEPTAALTLTETRSLFAVVRRLAAQDVSIIYVSHRLAEIFELCTKVVVLKDGRLAGTREVARATVEDLIQLMVGRKIEFARDVTPREPGATVLEAAGIVAPPFVNDASIVVRRGEIVCLAGLIGAGRTEFCETIFGVRKRQGGTVSMDGRVLRCRGAWDAMAAGIGMICEDRKDGGLFLHMDVAANVASTVLGRLTRGVEISKEKTDALARRYVDALRIATPSLSQLVGNLSGGNQQKVLIAKWLATEPRLLIVDEPTRGVDVGARAEIYRILRQLASDGMALLVVSSDLPEVLTLADRIVVMAEGRTVGELAGDEATEESILRLAARFTPVSPVDAKLEALPV